MTEHLPAIPNPASDLATLRGVAQSAFSRTASAPLVAGNDVRLLLDGEANFAAWLAAIAEAKHTVYFENYIYRNDETGGRFLEALVERANAGVKVRVLVDWLGSFSLSRGFWAPLINAGGSVRFHNPPQLYNPTSILRRDHRKTVVVDGLVGFVAGICVSDSWLGNARRGVEPWRDTGVEIRGPAVRDLVTAFAEVWEDNGRAIPRKELHAMPEAQIAGDIDLRVVPTAPNLLGIYRLDLLIAAIAQKRLWLTDAYFAGVPAYVQALRAAALDGVDVRLLVPGGSDLPWLRPISTAGYRPLLEAGVRVFEWNGSMLHAKTAVADDRWARVGSTNLNLASWLTNYEMDVAIENPGFALQMADVFENDLAHSTELVLRAKRRVRIRHGDDKRSRPGRGSLARVTAGALRISRTVSAAVLDRRVLGPAEARALIWTACIPIGFAALVLFFPHVFAWFLAVIFSWIGAILILRALQLRGKNPPED